jgi:hypothetical protein
VLFLTNHLKICNFLQVEIQCQLYKSINNNLLQFIPAIGKLTQENQQIFCTVYNNGGHSQLLIVQSALPQLDTYVRRAIPRTSS